MSGDDRCRRLVTVHNGTRAQFCDACLNGQGPDFSPNEASTRSSSQSADGRHDSLEEESDDGSEDGTSQGAASSASQGGASQGAGPSGLPLPGFPCALGCGTVLPFGYHSQDCGACSRAFF